MGISSSAASAAPSHRTHATLSTRCINPPPRPQVQSCLPELLRLCGAEHALPPAARNGGAAAAAAAAGAVRLSVDLHVLDEAGRCWSVLLKTWQNVVSGEHRPTFVLENTGALGERLRGRAGEPACRLDRRSPLAGLTAWPRVGGLRLQPRLAR